MKISVLTCIYNQAPAIFRNTALSVAALGPEIEWLIVDDGSDANFASAHKLIAEELGPKDTTRYFHLSRNSGLSVARNFGIRQAIGAWVVVLDSDDELVPIMVSSIRDASDSTHLMSFAADYFSDAPKWNERRPVFRFRELFERHAGTSLDPFLWFDFYYHGIVARRAMLNKIRGYNETLRVGEDQDILLRAVEHAGLSGVKFCDEVAYRYRKNPAGVCGTQWPDVLKGYTQTMVVAAHRRGARFTKCRLGGCVRIDGAEVDCYEYFDPSHGWINWTSASNESEPGLTYDTDS